MCLVLFISLQIKSDPVVCNRFDHRVGDVHGFLINMAHSMGGMSGIVVIAVFVLAVVVAVTVVAGVCNGNGGCIPQTACKLALIALQTFTFGKMPAKKIEASLSR